MYIDEICREGSLSRINESEYSQPICTALQVALVDLLRHWGIQPAYVVGHSSGEIAAAYCIGALSRESAWEIAYHRGRLCEKISLMEVQKQGAMLAANLSEQEVHKILKEHPTLKVVVACINSPSNVTLSGQRSGIDALETILAQKDVFVRRLKVEHAYHSPQMKLIAQDYLNSIEHVNSLRPKHGQIRMFSSVTGLEVTPEVLEPAYWVKNLVSPVKFLSAVQILMRHPPREKSFRRGGRSAVDIFLEIGPHSTLKGPLKQILDEYKLDFLYFHMLSRGKSGLVTALGAVSSLFCHGITADILRVNRLDKYRGDTLKVLVDLPVYPWNPIHRFWYEPRISSDYRHRSHPRHDLLGAPALDNNPLEPRWRNFLRLSEAPWIREHKVRISKAHIHHD